MTMARKMVVSRRLSILTGWSPSAWPGPSSRDIPLAYVQSKATPCVLARLALAGILFWASMSALLLRSDMAYADPTGGKPVAGEETIDAPDIWVRIEAGRLTLEANNASLADVLTMVGKQAGIEVLMRGDLDVPVTKSFLDEPLDGAIAHLLRNTSFVMIYGQPQDAGDPPPIVHIRIINSEAANQTTPVATFTGDFDEDQSEAAIAARRAIMLGFDSAPENGTGLFADLAGLGNNQRLYAMEWLADVRDEDAIRALARFLALDGEPTVPE